MENFNSQRINKLEKTIHLTDINDSFTLRDKCEQNIKFCNSLLESLKNESKIIGKLQDSITTKLLSAKRNKSVVSKIFGNSELGKIRKELLSILIKVVKIDIEITKCNQYKNIYELQLAKLNKNKNLINELQQESLDIEEALEEYYDNAHKLSEKAEKYKNLSDKKVAKEILEFQHFIGE